MKEKRAAPVAVMLIVMIYLLIPLAVSSPDAHLAGEAAGDLYRQQGDVVHHQGVDGGVGRQSVGRGLPAG